MIITRKLTYSSLTFSHLLALVVPHSARSTETPVRLCPRALCGANDLRCTVTWNTYKPREEDNKMSPIFEKHCVARGTNGAFFQCLYVRKFYDISLWQLHATRGRI